jgi:glutathione S-transferase
VPDQELGAEHSLDVLYVLTDCRGRHAELLGSAAHAATPQYGIQREQRIERRQATGHGLEILILCVGIASLPPTPRRAHHPSVLQLHDNSDSANGYKVRLLASFLGIELQVHEVDIFRGESRRPEFLRVSRFGQIPVLVLEDGTTLPESNAILCHLAEGTVWLPPVGTARSRVLAWLFFEQYSHEPYVATPRFLLRHTAPDHPRRAELGWRQARGRQALGILNDTLAEQAFLAGDSATIADIALFAYTHHADEAGFDLSEFPHVEPWLARIRAFPRFVPMIPPAELTLV